MTTKANNSAVRPTTRASSLQKASAAQEAPSVPKLAPTRKDKVTFANTINNNVKIGDNASFNTVQSTLDTPIIQYATPDNNNTLTTVDMAVDLEHVLTENAQVMDVSENNMLSTIQPAPTAINPHPFLSLQQTSQAA